MESDALSLARLKELQVEAYEAIPKKNLEQYEKKLKEDVPSEIESLVYSELSTDLGKGKSLGQRQADFKMLPVTMPPIDADSPPDLGSTDSLPLGNLG